VQYSRGVQYSAQWTEPECIPPRIRFIVDLAGVHGLANTKAVCFFADSSIPAAAVRCLVVVMARSSLKLHTAECSASL
jgi:hypothetical protein